MSEVAVEGRGKAKAEVIEASRMVDETICPLSPRTHLGARREQLEPSSVSESRKVSCEDLGKEIHLTLSHSGLSSCLESLSSTSDEGFLDSLPEPCNGGLVRRRDRVGEG